MEQPVVLFDGICNFCNFWVQFVIRRDKKAKLKFAVLQSETAKSILPIYSIDSDMLTSVILIEDGKAFLQSTAALRICKYLDGGWKLMYVLIIIPSFLRNAIYNWISKNRYKWFGKKEECWIPTPDLRERFLD